MADTSVKYFHGSMPGAPVLSGTAGALINVLDACLVNGFGVSAVASLVVAGEVATATISGGHSGEVGSVMTVAGATPSGLNGEKKVLSVGGGNTTLTFDATGIADQTATGSITIKVSGAGWVKAFSGTNLAAYRAAMWRRRGVICGWTTRRQDGSCVGLSDDDRGVVWGGFRNAFRRLMVDEEHGGRWQRAAVDAGSG
jgi:hypothetical protein